MFLKVTNAIQERELFVMLAFWLSMGIQWHLEVPKIFSSIFNAVEPADLRRTISAKEVKPACWYMRCQFSTNVFKPLMIP